MAEKTESNIGQMTIGCGIAFAIVAAIIAAVIQADSFKFIVMGAVIGALVGLFVDPESAESGGKAKAKRKTREGVMMGSAFDEPRRSSRGEVSRLEAPGGYVPFEMTRTETQTKDAVKTETEIKTYIDSREVRAVSNGGMFNF